MFMEDLDKKRTPMNPIATEMIMLGWVFWLAI
jgi:hypothetical protein